MMKTLGEKKVEERDDVTALIVRTTRRWLPWDAWLIVDALDYNYDGDGREHYGYPGLEPRRPFREFYNEKVYYYAKKLGARRSEDRAAQLARRHLKKFWAWREKQRAIERSMEDAEVA